MTVKSLARVDPADIQHLVVLGHPSPVSFNGSVAQRYCSAVEACGQRAVLRDLYAVDFDPLLCADERPDRPGFKPSPDVAAELAMLKASAVVVLVYPLWFGMPPAIIKGYVDRVLGAGHVARDIQCGRPTPLMKDKRLVIMTTSGTTRPWLEENGQWLSLRQAFDLYLAAIFGVADPVHLHFDAVTSGMSAQAGEEKLWEVEEQARTTAAAVLAERHAVQIQELQR